MKEKTIERLKKDLGINDENRIKELSEANAPSFGSITEDLGERIFSLVRFQLRSTADGNKEYAVAVMHDVVDDKDYSISIKTLTSNDVLDDIVEGKSLKASEWEEQDYYRFYDYKWPRGLNVSYLDVMNGNVTLEVKNNAKHVFKATVLEAV